MKCRLRSIVCLLGLSGTVAAEPVESRPVDRTVDYRQDIQPILAENCYRCHGPDEQESGLRLDRRSGVLEGGYSGAAVVPGKSVESLLIAAVTGTGDASKMPPEGEPLSADKIQLLKAWIDQGAAAPEDEADGAGERRGRSHWSLQPLAHPAIPAVSNAAWVRNPIDAFVLARLEAEGLAPSPEADRATLARRLSLDLLGLPPPIEEIEAFLADPRDDAYERLVERLLASPHYGERWGRHWLDQARYADSNGYTIDGGRSIWKYRDWVIEALNRDLPFDQFTIEQIAGDMLDNASVDQIVATGFHRNTLKNEEGGTDPEQFRVEAVVDRVNTTGSVFLGLTIGCARCHDHKYDPISQREFYEFFALLNNADEPTLPVPTDQQSKEEPALLAEIAQVEKRLAELDGNSSGRQAEWEGRFAGRLDVAWTVLEPLEFTSDGGAGIEKLDDGSLLVGGNVPDRDTYRITSEIPSSGITGLRLEVLTHDTLPHGGPGLADNGNFVLNELSAVREPAVVAAAGGEASTGSVERETPVAIELAMADYEHASGPVAAAIDGKPDTFWTIYAETGLNVERQATFVFKQDVAAGGKLRVTLVQDYKNPRYNIGRLRISVTGAPRDVLKLDEAVRAAMAVKLADRGDDERERVLAYFRTVDPERLPLAAAHAELKERQKQLATAVTTSLVMKERAEPRETRIHIRGDFLRPGARVQPGVPGVLPQIAAAGSAAGRLDLARWLVDEANPLTPRVTVNRIWQQYFGQGLVTTDNDFGMQGSPPTHPELLDWLAGQLIERGWSTKAMHRLIVTSATYRQSSAFREDQAQRDPYNKLLARQPRLRLEAEVIRDVALGASGLLTREIGGPGVYPPQPEGIYRFTQQVKYWTISTGPDRFRRGMYTYFWRSSPYPLLMTFDAPDANTACTRRPRSNTPLQALTLANDRVFVECAQALAARALGEAGPGDGERIAHVMRLCLAREPSDVESRRLAEFLQDQRSRFAGLPAEAEKVAPAQRVPGVAAPEAAAWTALARVVLNLDEFITRE